MCAASSKPDQSENTDENQNTDQSHQSQSIDDSQCADGRRTRQREALGKLADLVSSRRLGTPAIFMLESIKPLSLVTSQALLFFEPILEAFCTPGDYRTVAEALEDRENLEWLIQRLEVLEEARSWETKADTDPPHN